MTFKINDNQYGRFHLSDSWVSCMSWNLSDVCYLQTFADQQRWRVLLAQTLSCVIWLKRDSDTNHVLHVTRISSPLENRTPSWLQFQSVTTTHGQWLN